MQKDVIYIDVEDDITAIIGKVKDAKHKIVALVPPKRVGVLQSAVNLRLVNRAATQKNKRLVLITNNKALTALAAAATIPVAKSLQSKPELAPIDALQVDDGDDVIDGAELPVGDHAKQAPEAAGGEAATAVAGLTAANTAKATPPASGEAVKPKVKRGSMVPNFNTFRKKLVLVVALVLLLVGFLVWALVFAPSAKVAVLMRTTDAAISQQVNLVSGVRTSAASNIIEASSQTVTNDVSVEFEATGERNVGEKATGTVRFSQQSLGERTVPAGTRLTASGGLVFVTNSAVTIPASTIGPGCFPTACPGEATGGVTAAESGEQYNGTSGSLSGAGSGVSAAFSTAASGGTDRTVQVVRQSDIDTARDKAIAAIDRSAALRELTAKFGDGYIVLEDSLQIDNSELKSSVAVDAEAPNGRPTYGGKVTFAMYGVSKTELEDYLKTVLERQIDNPDRLRVYDSGVGGVNFTNVDQADTGIRATLTTNGKIGPTIDESEVKQLAAGGRIGDIQSAIEGIEGVRSVDVELSPFWVTRAPGNVDKIRVEFQLDE